MKKELKLIASKSLGIDTLKTQNLDRLDFHDLPVWEIKYALEKAYKAGQRSVSN